jgi:aminopeptidase N
MRSFYVGIWILLLTAFGHADTYVRQPEIDIMHYDLSLELNDDTDTITATAKIRVRMRAKTVSRIRLDFSGMKIDGLRMRNSIKNFSHHDGSLWIEFHRKYKTNEIAVVEVRYHGKPEHGILIRKNKYGRRVLFTENWPDRARNWIPSIDHPSDKATVRITVTAPRKYDVVSNGHRVEEKLLPKGRKRTQWVESKEIPTYCIALGVAEFAIVRPKPIGRVPIEWYFYREDSASAARKFRSTASALAYFSSLIAPFPYEKLAQVQATVSLGGMENSSAIFYNEPSLQEPIITDEPVPHEIAHQWFGDSVTQSDWDQLWLSEGFATYFDALFCEHLQGAEALKQIMADAAERLVAEPSVRWTPIIDPGQTDLMKKLNLMNYEKGAWVLHMLRGMLGDASFFDGIRRYYRSHEGGNATSEDLRESMESAGATSLSTFFKQWLYQAGWPEYQVSWRWDTAAAEVELSIRQTQTTGLFDMPLEIAFLGEDQKTVRKFRIFEKAHTFRIPLPAKPSSVETDPNGWVLKSVAISQP